MRLSEKRQWERRWKEQAPRALGVRTSDPMFKERHRLFQKHVGGTRPKTCLEVGAYPGNFLKYFFENFDCQPWGVEYVDSCAAEAEARLNEEGIPARLIAKDFFELEGSEAPGGKGWDLTVSFGFVEHFHDSTDAVAKHIEVTSPGGMVIISIPNHAGIYGPIMRVMDRAKWSQHNLMSLRDLEGAVSRAKGAELLFSGYVGRFGLWNAGVYSKLKSEHPKLYPFVRAPLWVIERLGQWVVPNNRWTSPDALVILRKRK